MLGPWRWLLVFACWTFAPGLAWADQPSADAPPECEAPLDDQFASEVWARVVSQSCIHCHKAGADAEDSRLVLIDAVRLAGDQRHQALLHNQRSLATMAAIDEDGQSRLLRKVLGELDHGGGDVLAAETAGYHILARFVERMRAVPGSQRPRAPLDEPAPGDFFDEVVFLEPPALLRRATLALAGRLPTEEERARVASQDLDGVAEVLETVMQEEAFYLRLREGFDDIFLTRGYDGVPENALSYSHFSTTRHWYQKFDLSHIEDETKRRQAGYKLANDYRAAMLGEPMALVEHIVRNDRPITEIVTADYIMVTPYTARGYGLYEQLESQFQDPNDPFEYVPVRLPALKARNARDNQESPTGFYPHAGLLSTFQYLMRYPTTETNRNRLRARMYYEHFLGVDVMELAARVSDAAAVTEQFEIPTMQASECAVCHRTVDPVAGLFQDYYDLNGVYGRRREGWYQDMFQAGFEGEELPADERWRALAWLGERTARDPRFATTMVEHVHYILTGRKPLLPPRDLDDPLEAAHRRAYNEQRREIEAIAADMVAADFNLKAAFQGWVRSPFYRADGLATATDDPHRQAELADLGVVRMLSPEQLERKIAAVFGERWGKLQEQMAILYGGIDYKEVTERAVDPSGAMGAIQRTMANDVACRHTLADFALPADQRRLFPGIEPDVRPGQSPEGDQAVRETLVHLHRLVLGREDAVDSTEIDRSFALFAGIVTDAASQPEYEKREIYHCRRNVPDAPDDPHYTIRAWRGVLTYLLRRIEFLYE